MKLEQLIFDWNKLTKLKVRRKIELDDETLRDGLQSPSVTQPTIEQKKEIVTLMEKIGIDTCDIGLPATSQKVANDCLELARFIVASKFKIKPNCAARTLINDIKPIVEISQKVGMPVEAYIFVGTSPIRQYAEQWDINFLKKSIKESISFAVREDLPVTFVTEDTTRSKPRLLKMLYNMAIDYGARGICACDTVGHATAWGVFNLIKYIKQNIIRKKKIRLDFHGHRDRGLDIINTIFAILAGADRVHGCGLGIGERVGNTPIDLLIVNLHLMKIIKDKNFAVLPEYCKKISEYTNFPIPKNYPVFGEDAFETGTGIHAAAIIKALNRNELDIADSVYSGVPPSVFGRKQKILVGPMSGRSNIIYWLKNHGYKEDPELLSFLFDYVKKCNRILKDEELEAVIMQFNIKK
ncbi:MAG: LeuA family protein [Planctomycetota bacterium]